MDVPQQKPKLTLATKVTIVRIMGVPVFIALLVYYLIGLRNGEDIALERTLALVVFAAVALTDALDGYLARSRNEVTDLGRMLDPIADKALLLSGLVLLTRPSLPALAPHIPVWFTTLVISRDVVLILGSFLVHELAGNVTVQPRISGKLATVFQMATIIWVLVDDHLGAGWWCRAAVQLVRGRGRRADGDLVGAVCRGWRAPIGACSARLAIEVKKVSSCRWQVDGRQ
ncbi:MAG: CDP-alcohol phosphatidyltransferase family protein [Kiritimatiellaeota bacterium]|nr:CDP-alcohol phosphatidyltransferase family protein [Kiritimatiellota bacterium]